MESASCIRFCLIFIEIRAKYVVAALFAPERRFGSLQYKDPVLQLLTYSYLPLVRSFNDERQALNTQQFSNDPVFRSDPASDHGDHVFRLRGIASIVRSG